jgi:Bacterial Ig-like domain
MQNHTKRWFNNASVNAMTAIAIGAMLIFSVSGMKAFADNVQDDIQVDPAQRTITSGGSTTVNYWIQANGAGGSPGCDASDGSSVKITFDVPNGVSVSPSSVTFNQCGDTNTKSATYSSDTPGSYDITVSAQDSSGNYNTNPAKFTLIVNAPEDNTAPEVDSTSPEDGTTGVEIGSDVSATFSEKMKADTFSTSTFTVEDGDDNIAGDVSLSSDGLTATFNPSSDLAHSTTYTATIKGTVTDEAGNQLGADYSWTFTTESAPDTTPPTTTASLDPASHDGSNGWYKSSIIITLSAEDNSGGSGVKSTTYEIDGGSTQTYSGPFTVSDDGEHAVTFRSEDNNGNKETDKSTSFKIDTTKPEITINSDISDGQEFYFGDIPSEPTCSATDATSGVDSNGCQVSGYGTAVGSHTLTFSTKDNAGNEATQTLSYKVLPWTIKGFYQPVDMNGVNNLIKAGSTVPLKFEVFKGSTELTDISVRDTVAQKKVTCDTGATVDEVEQYTTTGQTTFRYDTSGGQFIDNWKSPTTKNVCYQVTMTFDDGSSVAAMFRTR